MTNYPVSPDEGKERVKEGLAAFLHARANSNVRNLTSLVERGNGSSLLQ